MKISLDVDVRQLIKISTLSDDTFIQQVINMAEEIEFESPTSEESKKIENLESKVTALETKIAELLSAVSEIGKKVEAKLEEEAEKPAEEPKPEEKPAEEPKEEDKETKEAVEKMSKQLDTMTKKLEELESKPARITQALEADVNPDKKVEEFLNKVTGGEALVYAEKKGIKWGNKE